jgi:oxygen-independent coproporphyrinogen-3 oxidase
MLTLARELRQNGIIIAVPLGLYISIPFCKTKCSYCNFASDVFSRAVFRGYVDRLCADINHAKATAQAMGGQLESSVDSMYLGGGTPTVLDCGELERLFLTISQNFDISPDAEITVECAPATLNPDMLDTLCRVGVNRVSLGVQSFVDREASAVGRLHNRSTTLSDIARLRAAGISSINLDLIAGLPHQTTESWQVSLNDVIDSGVPHASVYMLEVDEDSRLGRELIAGGTRYHAHHVPDEDLTASLYETACDKLCANGLRQYEISNFGREGFESRHNLKYWTRQPYFGFGVDAHSMLPALNGEMEAVRFSNPESLEKYVAGGQPVRSAVDANAALEETFFLGLRLNSGVDLDEVQREFGHRALCDLIPAIEELEKQNLLEKQKSNIRLTGRGRLLSNEVFERFLGEHSTTKL